MSNPSVALTQPMVLGEEVPRTGRFGGKSVVLISLFVHLGLIMVWSATGGQQLVAQEPATAMISWSTNPATSLRSVRPARHDASQLMRFYGIGSTPLEQMAIAAVEANNRANNMRDVSVQGKKPGKNYRTDSRPKGPEETEAVAVQQSMSSMDEVTKEKVEKLEKVISNKAADMPGVTGPLGFFDPVGFSADCKESKLLFYREVELKHGRIAMLATLGILVGEQFHPFFGGNIDVPSYIAFQQTPLQSFWPAVVAAIAIPEVFSVQSFNDVTTYDEEFPDRAWTMRSNRVSGDLGFDPLGLKPKDPEEFKVMQTKELNNGRLAMIAAAGMIAQELATGQKLF